ncbi:MAG TPA: hypothetical protein VLD65_09130 [Anaerolineales bacterium]|nr:hypothetical protein [Anaerolineales bacterium]
MKKIQSNLVTLHVLAITVMWLAAACSLQAALTPGETTVPHLDQITSAVSSGSKEDLLSLFKFSSLPCTKAEGMGGPPKCLADEAEGTLVEVLPILGPEGHHIRRSEMSSWPGIGDAQLYAAYRNSKSTYSDEFFPAGDYGIAFVMPDKVDGVVFQVTEEGIVRLDYQMLSTIDEIIKNSEVIVGPKPPSK